MNISFWDVLLRSEREIVIGLSTPMSGPLICGQIADFLRPEMDEASSPQVSPMTTTVDPLTSIDDYLANPNKKPPPSIKSHIFPVLAHRRMEAEANKDYATAARLARAEKDLWDYFHSLASRERAVRSVETAATSSSDLVSRLQTLRQQFEQAIEQLRRERENLMAELRLSHEYELKEFQQMWEHSEALKSFAKPSPALLQLREIERRKVELMDYEGAEQMKKCADLLEREETNQAHDRIVRGRKSKFNQIRRRQQMEIEAADRMTHKKLFRLQNERDAVLGPIERQLQKAKEREKNEPEVIRTRHERGQGDRSPKDEGDDVDLPSLRTVRRIYRMKVAAGPQRLDVGGVTGDEHTDTKRKRARSVHGHKPV
jgi:hypothetical protein